MFGKLEGLDSLARRDGVDIRPTLVRVLTDLYVQKPSHTVDEAQREFRVVPLLLAGVRRLPPRRAAAAPPPRPRPGSGAGRLRPI